MKNIFISSILVLLVSVSLYAKDNYIQIMSLSDSSNLKGAKSDISKLGYEAYIKKRGKWYTVYAGPFKDFKEANNALAKVKKNISKGAFLTKITADTPKKAIKKETKPVEEKTIKKPVQKQEKAPVPPVKTEEKKKVAGKVLLEDILPVQEKTSAPAKQDKAFTSSAQTEKKKVTQKVTTKEIIPVQEKTSAPAKQDEASISSAQTKEKKEIAKDLVLEDKGFYIGLAAGLTIVDIEKNDITGNLPLNFELEDSGINYSAEIGYYFNNNIFISLNYQQTDLEDVSLSSAFTTLNYQFDSIYSISPYIGAIAGYGMRTWENSPIDDAIGDATVSSFLGGLQIGSDITLYSGLSLYFYYRYLMMDTTTNITVGSEESSIEYGAEQNLNMGIKYHF